MACSPEYIDFVCSQLRGTGAVRARMMFGDYCIYINEKPLLLCCNDTTYIPKNPAIDRLMADAECGVPYEGARERYILDIEHGSEARQVVRLLEKSTPFPEQKKRKAASKNH